MAMHPQATEEGTRCQNYVLYHHLSSICSIMVRYCYALRGIPRDDQSDIHIREESVDIFHEGQLTEHYLCDINPYGEVPTLAYEPLEAGKPIPDSLKITLYMSQFYPSMIPADHDEQIRSLLQELHAINYYSLTFTGRPGTIQGIQAALHKTLEGDISERYRRAIEFKLKHMEESRVHAIEPQSVEANRQRTITLLRKLEPDLASSQSGWLYNLEQPSALDAHLVVFLARMKDVGRNDLIPDVFDRYAIRAMAGSEWNQVQHGSTKPASA